MKDFSNFITIQNDDIDFSREIDSLKKTKCVNTHKNIGAITTFLGTVRDLNEGCSVNSMFLEHYPGMTELSIEKILKKTFDKWPVLSVRVIHRVGLLSPGDNIVFIGVGSEHRKISFDACEYIMDYLKTKAPFWKKEVTSNGERWVKAKVDDDVAVRNWESNS